MNPTLSRSWIISACLSNVDLVCTELSAWLTEQNLCAHLFPMELLAREALNNAILHGCKLDPEMHVRCEVQRTENAVELNVKDDGPGFEWQPHLQNKVVDDDHENGRGIHLYRLYADVVEFNPPGNQVSLTRLLKLERKTLMETTQVNKVDDGPRQIFCPDGDITAVTAPAIRVQLKSLLDQGARAVVVDFVNTRLIDSTGIGLLVATHNSLQRIDGSLALINVSQDLLELLKAFRLDKHFSISGDPRLG